MLRPIQNKKKLTGYSLRAKLHFPLFILLSALFSCVHIRLHTHGLTFKTSFSQTESTQFNRAQRPSQSKTILFCSKIKKLKGTHTQKNDPVYYSYSSLTIPFNKNQSPNLSSTTCLSYYNLIYVSRGPPVL
jgi:hypothetical protein